MYNSVVFVCVYVCVCVCVNVQSCVRVFVLGQNTPSPWLPQASLVEGQGLRTPVPVRPASADPHHSVKSNPHTSPCVSKTTE